jgi:hypothetical protein
VGDVGDMKLIVVYLPQSDQSINKSDCEKQEIKILIRFVSVEYKGLCLSNHI